MLVRLFLLFTLVPLVELVLLLVLADWTSWQWTLLLVLVTGIVGAALARWQGLRCWRRVHEQLAAGQIPGDPLVDAMMILVAGALLITPGILTDLVGFGLLLPPLRRLLKGHLRRRFEARLTIGPGLGGFSGPGAAPPDGDRIIDVKVIDASPEDGEL